MNNAQRQAQRDAAEYARAHMSYGEGAGTRRKLIYGTVDYKMATVPGYREAFHRASERQDMAKIAKEAERNHRRRTLNTALTRNTRAVVTGRYQDVNTMLLVVGGSAYFAHKYGIDKKLYETGKEKVEQVKVRFKRFKKTGSHKIHSL